jgi:hypothetical protein
MSRNRLSKLQKWILIKCFKKTLLNDNSDLTILQAWSYRNSNWKDDKHYWKYLYRSEILLDFFKCEPDRYKFAGQRNQHFKGTNNKAQVTLTNSLSNLESKGLIQTIVGVYSRWFGIILTEKGLLLTHNLIKSDVNINNLLLTLRNKYQDINNKEEFR